MPQRENVHIDQALTNLAIRYRNLAFVAAQVFPVIPVLKESDKYYKFSREELREVETLRAIGAEANEIDWDVSSETYSAEEYALRKLVADRIVANADSPIRPRITSVNKIMRWLNLGYEKRVQKLAQSSNTITNNATPSIKWNGTSPTIEANIDTAKDSVRDNAGTDPNSLLMNSTVKDVVKKDSTVRNLIRYTMPAARGLLTNGELPPVLWNLKTIIAGSVENTANEGQSDSISKVWVDSVLVFFAELNPSIDALTLGYTFRVRQNGKLPVLVTTWREDKRKGNMVEASVIQDEKVVAAECGYLITDVL